MRWSDLVDPDRLVSVAARVFFYLLGLILARDLMTQWISRLSGWDFFWILILMLAVSPLAYWLRQRRRPDRRPLIQRRGAERTPVVPPEGGEA